MINRFVHPIKPLLEVATAPVYLLLMVKEEWLIVEINHRGEAAGSREVNVSWYLVPRPNAEGLTPDYRFICVITDSYVSLQPRPSAEAIIINYRLIRDGIRYIPSL